MGSRLGERILGLYPSTSVGLPWLGGGALGLHPSTSMGLPWLGGLCPLADPPSRLVVVVVVVDFPLPAPPLGGGVWRCAAPARGGGHGLLHLSPGRRAVCRRASDATAPRRREMLAAPNPAPPC
mmetsp:Transcript_5783/g.19671  ORF Transcript_5783/g.19671 Transcript_5783/m.19671 type:complete len:124 (+) Transcript_5783:1994-2365(+)